MSDLEEFEDWSHPSRPLTLPRRRIRIHWWRLLGAAVACFCFWGAWHLGHLIHDAYATVFGP
jgi:hypothetical protein